MMSKFGRDPDATMMDTTRGLAPLSLLFQENRCLCRVWPQGRMGAEGCIWVHVAASGVPPVGCARLYFPLSLWLVFRLCNVAREPWRGRQLPSTRRTTDT